MGASERPPGMKARRRRFSPSVYRAILFYQEWRCACCGEELGPPGTYEFDHIQDLRFEGKDEPSNLQALIKGHHTTKTTKGQKAAAKSERIRKRRGLRDKRPSLYDKIMAKALER